MGPIKGGKQNRHANQFPDSRSNSTATVSSR